tara:strand:- start:442 stop:621 length:180 start_codon:yes stop_codon:yes gene_type:complete
MSKYADSKELVTKEIKLTVKDTDFLLKLIMRSSFDGNEIETAHVVITKLAELHRANLES